MICSLVLNLQYKKSFCGERKSIFHHFQRAFSCQKLSQTSEVIFKDFRDCLNLFITLDMFLFNWVAFDFSKPRWIALNVSSTGVINSRSHQNSWKLKTLVNNHLKNQSRIGTSWSVSMKRSGFILHTFL